MKPDETLSSATLRRVSTRKRGLVQQASETGDIAAANAKRSKAKTTKCEITLEKNVKTKPHHQSICTTSSRPLAEECYYVTEALSQLHPNIVQENNKRRKALLDSKLQLHHPTKKNKDDISTPVTDQIIGTMLSQNTTDANCHRAFARLKKDFPGGWGEVANAKDISRIENSIKVAGLAKIRAQRIQGMLQSIQQERGEASFEYLQEYDSNEDIIKELSRFKGMGPKTISCVLLFALGRNDFPVDTHVLRITQQMGWVGKSATRESAYDHFKNTIPGDCMMDLHCLLVQHGKVCFNCAANGRPQFPPMIGKAMWVCPLVGIKRGKIGFTSGKNDFSTGIIAVKVEKEMGDDMTKEVSSSKLRECSVQIKAEEITSGINIKTENTIEEDATECEIKPEEITSGIAVKVEQL